MRHLEAVSAADADAEAAIRKSRKTEFKKVCITDPDASMATNARNRRMKPAYKQHTIVDDLPGLSKGRVAKAVVVGDDYPALSRARGRRERWSEEDQRLYQRHRWRSEGLPWRGEELARPSPSDPMGLANMKIQAYLTAAAVNLKRLAAALFDRFLGLLLLMHL